MKYGNKNICLLIDTGASISAFFTTSLDHQLQDIDPYSVINIKGISGTTRSHGTANISLQADNIMLTHKFVLMKAFDDEMHGILGSDFFQKYSASIDYETFKISLLINNTRVDIPMESKYNDSITIPPRCEIIKCFTITHKSDCIILPQELGQGIFLAGIITRPKDNVIPVRLLNTREKTVTIKNFKPTLVDANEYEIVAFTDENTNSV